MMRGADFKAFMGLELSLVFWLFSAGQPVAAADFMRGDVNSDRRLSISDAYALSSYLFRGKYMPECMEAADADDEGTVDLVDVILIVGYLYLGSGPPAPPFPDVGPDPTEGRHPCDAYGNGAPREDPDSSLAVLDAIAPGGANARASIRIAYTAPYPLGGLAGDIRVSGGWVQGVQNDPHDLTPSQRVGFMTARLTDSLIRFGMITVFPKDPPLAAGADVPVLEIVLCLKKGTPAGEYPLTLEAGELVDWASGQAIIPTRRSGKLTVLEAVTKDDACASETAPPPPLNATFKIGSAVAQPGESVRLPFIIRADAGVQGYSFSVDFDEEVLEGTLIEPAWQMPDGSNYGFQHFEINNLNVTPGSGGVDEGFLVGGVVFDVRDDGKDIVMPPDTDNVALYFHFRVKPETTVAATEVKFLPGGRPREAPPVPNYITAWGHRYTDTPELESSFILFDGRVNIVPDVTIFVRGDSNRDGFVDIADPLATLGYLFQGAPRPACPDAADANDDGKLDIADPAMTLRVLFLAGSSLPPPGPRAGRDPTEDSLSCLREFP